MTLSEDFLVLTIIVVGVRIAQSPKLLTLAENAVAYRSSTSKIMRKVAV